MVSGFSRTTFQAIAILRGCCELSSRNVFLLSISSAVGCTSPFESVERDTSKVWLEGPVQGGGVTGVRPLTTTYDHAECGRVLYSSYHTAGGDRFLPSDSFPGYCSGNKLSPQERVLLYLILHVADCIDIVE